VLLRRSERDKNWSIFQRGWVAGVWKRGVVVESHGVRLDKKPRNESKKKLERRGGEDFAFASAERKSYGRKSIIAKSNEKQHKLPLRSVR